MTNTLVTLTNMSEVEIAQATLNLSKSLSGQNDRTLFIFVGLLLIVGLILAVRYLMNHTIRLQTRNEAQTEKVVEVAITCRTAIENQTECQKDHTIIMQKVLSKLDQVKLVLVAFILSLTLMGCAGLKSLSPQTKARIESTASIVAYVGSSEILVSKPEYRLGFVAAILELKALEEGQVDITKLVAIVNRLPVKELKSHEGRIFITAGTMAIVSEIGVTPIEQIENLKPLIKAIREGLEKGVAEYDSTH